jgi:hypothetical protein
VKPHRILLFSPRESLAREVLAALENGPLWRQIDRLVRCDTLLEAGYRLAELRPTLIVIDAAVGKVEAETLTRYTAGNVHLGHPDLVGIDTAVMDTAQLVALIVRALE